MKKLLIILATVILTSLILVSTTSGAILHKYGINVIATSKEQKPFNPNLSIALRTGLATITAMNIPHYKSLGFNSFAFDCGVDVFNCYNGTDSNTVPSQDFTYAQLKQFLLDAKSNSTRITFVCWMHHGTASGWLMNNGHLEAYHRSVNGNYIGYNGSFPNNNPAVDFASKLGSWANNQYYASWLGNKIKNMVVNWGVSFDWIIQDGGPVPAGCGYVYAQSGNKTVNYKDDLFEEFPSTRFYNSHSGCALLNSSSTFAQKANDIINLHKRQYVLYENWRFSRAYKILRDVVSPYWVKVGTYAPAMWYDSRDAFRYQQVGSQGFLPVYAYNQTTCDLINLDFKVWTAPAGNDNPIRTNLFPPAKALTVATFAAQSGIYSVIPNIFIRTDAKKFIPTEHTEQLIIFALASRVYLPNGSQVCPISGFYLCKGQSDGEWQTVINYINKWKFLASRSLTLPQNAMVKTSTTGMVSNTDADQNLPAYARAVNDSRIPVLPIINSTTTPPAGTTVLTGGNDFNNFIMTANEELAAQKASKPSPLQVNLIRLEDTNNVTLICIERGNADRHFCINMTQPNAKYLGVPIVNGAAWYSWNYSSGNTYNLNYLTLTANKTLIIKLLKNSSTPDVPHITYVSSINMSVSSIRLDVKTMTINLCGMGDSTLKVYCAGRINPSDVLGSTSWSYDLSSNIAMVNFNSSSVIIVWS